MKIRQIISSIVAAIISVTASIDTLSAATYAEHSVLSKGSWKKISVKESGVCKITYDQLKGMGFSHPEKVSVYGYGGAQLSELFNLPKTDDLNETPIYDSGSALYFYAQGPRIWKHKALMSDHPFEINSNLYATEGYYFLSENSGQRNIIAMAETIEEDEEEVVIDKYMEHMVHKTESINPSKSGKGWFGDQTPSGKSFDVTFNVPDIDLTEEAIVYLNLAAVSNRTSQSNIYINGDFYKSVSYGLASGHTAGVAGRATITYTPVGERNNVSISYKGNSDVDKMWVEQIVFCAYKKLTANDGIVYFRDPRTSTPDIYRYDIQGGDSKMIVWDITHPTNTQQIPTQTTGDGISFRRNPVEMEEFVAFDPQSNKFVKAEFVENVKNQDLHACKGYDAIIITPQEFISEAQRLAALHEEHDNISSLIVTPTEIFNEFSSGTPDASAIRWFLKMFYDRGEARKSVILFGDGTFDNRDILKSNTKYNYILTYESGDLFDESKSYVSDDYYCFLDNSNNGLSNGRMKMDYSIGRLPVSTIQQATNMVDKVEKYLTDNQFGTWKNKVCLIADDNDGDTLASTVNKFFSYSDNIAKIIHGKDSAMEIQKIHIDAYTRTSGSNGNRYPEAEAAIKKSVENGVMVVNYIGHSSELAWSAERIFTQGEAGSLFNDKRGFWFTASCQFALFDDLKSSGGEDLVLNPNGGAMTLFSAARTVYDDKNDNINRSYISNLFERDANGEPLTIGEVCRRAKLVLPNDSNKMSYTLLGDPLLKMKYPEGNVTTDSITLIGQGKTDTIRALSEVKIFGHIEDNQHQLMDQFNGVVNIIIYDKETRMYTKGNSFKDEDQKTRNRHPYTDRLNVLFSGKAEVKNGYFSTVMKVTKDINYNYGTGRIYYYAYDEALEYDADGCDESFIIGGSNDAEITDSCGPNIKLFMNHKGFLSGDKVNNTPVLIAEVEDINGINASGSGIGHDITLTSEDKKITVLNSYFSYDIDSYSQGTITYPFPTLDPGRYNVKLKVWDLLNNSSEKSISFVVDEKEPIRVHSIDIFPSVAKEEATINISHDRPLTVKSYRIRVISYSGAEMLSTSLTTERLSQQTSWTWDLTDNRGVKVTNGLYLIRVEFETEDGKINALSDKIIVRSDR